MCHVPSWIKQGWIKQGEGILFLTDKDAEDHGLSPDDSTGHSAIRSVFSTELGENKEGLSSKTPAKVQSALKSGKMDSMISAGCLLIKGGTHTIPSKKVGEHLILRGRRTRVRMPNLTRVGNNISIDTGGVLFAPQLQTVRGEVDLGKGAKLVAPKLKRKK